MKVIECACIYAMDIETGEAVDDGMELYKSVENFGHKKMN